MLKNLLILKVIWIFVKIMPFFQDSKFLFKENFEKKMKICNRSLSFNFEIELFTQIFELID